VCVCVYVCMYVCVSVCVCFTSNLYIQQIQIHVLESEE
jgi:hypothetical protein